MNQRKNNFERFDPYIDPQGWFQVTITDSGGSGATHKYDNLPDALVGVLQRFNPPRLLETLAQTIATLRDYGCFARRCPCLGDDQEPIENLCIAADDVVDAYNKFDKRYS